MNDNNYINNFSICHKKTSNTVKTQKNRKKSIATIKKINTNSTTETKKPPTADKKTITIK